MGHGVIPNPEPCGGEGSFQPHLDACPSSRASASAGKIPRRALRPSLGMTTFGPPTTNLSPPIRSVRPVRLSGCPSIGPGRPGPYEPSPACRSSAHASATLASVVP